MHNLINRNKAAKCIAIRYPEIKNDIRSLTLQKNFAGIMQTVINHLFQLLQESKHHAVSAKIHWMGWLYKRGNNTIKDLIENLFVRSFHSMKKRCNPQQWNYLLTKSPKVFQRIYETQTNKDKLLKIKL